MKGKNLPSKENKKLKKNGKKKRSKPANAGTEVPWRKYPNKS